MTNTYGADPVDESPPDEWVTPSEMAVSTQVESPQREHQPQQDRTLERIDAVGGALMEAYRKTSMLKLTEEEEEKLGKPFEDHEIAIRPHDGLIYIPHILIAKRLAQVFGRGQFGMHRIKEWIDGDQVYAEWVLIIRGHAIGSSVCGHQYVPSNPKMNYSDALESTRGEAIRRLCGKELLCGDQVWDPTYAQTWCGRYAVRVGKYWEKKLPDDHEKRVNSDRPIAQPPQPQEPPKPREATEKTKEWVIKYLKPFKDQALEWLIDEAWILPTEGLEDIPVGKCPTTWEGLAQLLSSVSGETVTAQEIGPMGMPDPKPKPEKTDEDWWKAVIIPIPPRGMKKADYLKNPITLGQLAQEDSKKFFGYALNFKPEGREFKGKYYPASEADIQFRQALDAACDKNGWTKPE